MTTPRYAVAIRYLDERLKREKSWLSALNEHRAAAEQKTGGACKCLCARRKRAAVKIITELESAIALLKEQG